MDTCALPGDSEPGPESSALPNIQGRQGAWALHLPWGACSLEAGVLYNSALRMGAKGGTTQGLTLQHLPSLLQEGFLEWGL